MTGSTVGGAGDDPAACAVPGCGRPHYGHGFCRAHHGRWLRHGDPRADLPIAAPAHGRGVLSVRSAHRRVRATRGAAAGHRCSGCGGPAAVWCYDGADPAERVDPRGRRYSLDPDRYRPSCRFCLRQAAADRRAAFPRPRRRPALDVERAARLYAGGGQLPRPRRPDGRLPGTVLPGAARPRRRDPPAGRPARRSRRHPVTPARPTTAGHPAITARTPRATRHRSSRTTPPSPSRQPSRHTTTTTSTTDQQTRAETRTKDNTQTQTARADQRISDPSVSAACPAGPRRPEPARSTRGGVVDHVEGSEGLRRRLLPRRHRPRGLRAGRRLLHRRRGGRREPPGIWYGRGAEALGLVGEVDPLMMKALYTHGLDPRDPATADRETWGEAARFGSPPRNYQTAEEIYARLVEQHPDAGPEERAELRVQAGQAARQSVSFYDLVLSASKSHTLLWVAAERGARDAAAAGDHAGGGRARPGRGRAGGRVDGRAPGDARLPGRAGRLRPRRASRRRRRPVGRRARLDDRAVPAARLPRARPAAARARPDGEQDRLRRRDGPRPGLLADPAVEGRRRRLRRPVGRGVRVAGAGGAVDAAARTGRRGRSPGSTPTPRTCSPSGPPRSPRRWRSSSTRFRAETGREPTNRERAELAERASNLTKAAKVFGGETRDGQLARWAAEYDAAFGANVATLARQALGQAPAEAERWSERDIVTRALAEMEDTRQSWTRSNLMTAVVPRPARAPRDRPRAARAAARGADRSGAGPGPAPQPAHRPAGPGQDATTGRTGRASSSSRTRSGSPPPTQILGRGRAPRRRGPPRRARLDHRGRRRGRRPVRPGGSGAEHRPGHRAARHPHLRGGRRGAQRPRRDREVVPGRHAGRHLAAHRPPARPPPTAGDRRHTSAPPGREPPACGDGPRVFGVAYGQRQADVLAEEGVTARNIRRWLDGQDRLDAGRGSGDDETFRLRRGDLLVVDEAGAASTPDLVAIHRRCEAAGAKLLLVGDQKQLGRGRRRRGAGRHRRARHRVPARRGPPLHRGVGGPGVAAAARRRHRRCCTSTPSTAGWSTPAASSRPSRPPAAPGWPTPSPAATRSSSSAPTPRPPGCPTSCAASWSAWAASQEQGVPLGMGPTRSEWRGTVAGVGDLVQARRNAWHLEGWADNPDTPATPRPRSTARPTASPPPTPPAG